MFSLVFAELLREFRLSPGSYSYWQPNEMNLWIALNIAENIWDNIGTQLNKMYIKQV